MSNLAGDLVLRSHRRLRSQSHIGDGELRCSQNCMEERLLELRGRRISQTYASEPICNRRQ
ncbi:hypothetical protein L484_022298 [Morus notabilis]|uniref:Uncharacterized protein n=1 Tax=Morus notabilis TaxID=981085 RepID=W9SUW7_9ROSA|nr:hypothetical protein L484_022298 [Morus notabilis]